MEFMQQQAKVCFYQILPLRLQKFLFPIVLLRQKIISKKEVCWPVWGIGQQYFLQQNTLYWWKMREYYGKLFTWRYLLFLCNFEGVSTYYMKCRWYKMEKRNWREIYFRRCDNKSVGSEFCWLKDNRKWSNGFFYRNKPIIHIGKQKIFKIFPNIHSIF